MKKTSVEAIIQSLNQRQVQYLVVGGLAVVAHGYVRFTADVDLVLSVDRENLVRAVAALTVLDYRPRAPVKFEEFVDPANRRKWASEKGMTVFSLFSPRHPATEIDLFLEPPVDFPSAYARALRQEISTGIEAVFCSLEDLIGMKTAAGRARDLDDISHLRQLGKPDAK
jgi:predicted nucleotidyltransferase